MEKFELAEKVKQHKVALISTVAVAIVVALLISLASCSTTEDRGQKDIDTTTVVMESESPREEAEDQGGIEEDDGTDGAVETPSEASAEAPAEPNGGEIPVAAHASGPIAQETHRETSGAAPEPSPSAPQRKWVEDTQNVWIVDRAAWTEQKPIYETRERSICNVCGTDITGNTSAHNKAHMMAGEGSGYHSDVQTVQVGTETINHPEQGHWETKVVGGHWE